MNSIGSGDGIDRATLPRLVRAVRPASSGPVPRGRSRATANADVVRTGSTPVAGAQSGRDVPNPHAVPFTTGIATVEDRQTRSRRAALR